MACQCLIEAANALKDHLKGEKHIRQFVSYIPKPQKIEKTFEETIKEHDGFVIGLSKVEKFILPNDETAIPIFKCRITDCDGAFGTRLV